MILKFSLFLLASILLCGCSSRNQSNNSATPNVNQSNTGTGSGEQKALIKVRSTAFQDGSVIPKDYTCDGANVSPPLAWDSVPEKAKTLALVVDDPDAPSKTWVHWVVFNLPATTKGLPRDVALQEGAAGVGI